MTTRLLACAMGVLLACTCASAIASTPRLSTKTARAILHRTQRQQLLAPGNWTLVPDGCSRKSPRHIRCWYALVDQGADVDCPYLFDAYRHVGSTRPTWTDVLNDRCRSTNQL